jgi:hypothetical protein
MEGEIMSTETLRLIPGYRLRIVDLLREIEIVDDFTLVELCLTIRDSDEIDLDTLSALIHCRLAPFIEECLRPSSPPQCSLTLSAIQVAWQCEYDQPGETRWSPTTTLRLDVYGVGEIWKDHQPGGQWYEKGKDVSRCNTYAIELTPLYELRHLPIKIDPTMRIACSDDPEKTPLEIPAPRVTLLQLLYALFWEFSFFGTPTQRDAQTAELEETMRQIESGEARMIPWEEVKGELERKLKNLGDQTH